MPGALAGPYRVVCERPAERDLGVCEVIQDPPGRRAHLKLSPHRGGRSGPFLLGAQVLSSVRHPGLVEIFDHGLLPDGRAFLLRAALDGERLDERLARGAVGTLGIHLARDIAVTLGHLHGHGAVYLGLAPDRALILFDAAVPGGCRVKLLDCESARPMGREAGHHDTLVLDAPVTPLSPLLYLSPEQCSGAPGIGPPADVYALGSLLYQMVAGRPPRTGGSAMEVLDAHVRVEPPMLAPDLPGSSAGLSALLARMLAKEPALRPSMKEVHLHLEALLAEPAPPTQTGVVSLSFGNYQVERWLGEGGMGAVYAAVNRKTGHRAAIKVLHPHLSRYPQLAARFLNEARAPNQLQHPAFVRVFDWGQLPTGAAYIVMEYLEGESLGTRLRSGGPMAPPMVARLSAQIADAMDAAHREGIVHRDLKPDNVLIVPDAWTPQEQRVKIFDFGIAKLPERMAGLRTESGSVLGTPAYMAPEQWLDAPDADGKVDVYALGVIMYQLLVGDLPFAAQGLAGWLQAHTQQACRPLGERMPEAPAPLCELIHAMLAKRPEERPSMRQVADRLSVWHGEVPAASAPRPEEERRLPVYLLLDCSESMVGEGIEAVERGLAQLVTALRGDPHAVETAWVSVIVFAHAAVQVVPLTEVHRFTAPRLQVRPGTALGAALQLLHASIQREVLPHSKARRGDWRPLVFLLSDGTPTDEWRAGAARLRQLRPNIVALGCGPDFDHQIVSEFADHTLTMDGRAPEDYRRLFQWISASVSLSSQRLGTRGEVDLAALPSGVRRVTGAARSSVLRDATGPAEVFLLMRCSKSAQSYLVRFREAAVGGRYLAVRAHMVDGSYASTRASEGAPQLAVSSERLKGVAPCPYCENQSVGVCPCGTFFCQAPDEHSPICPGCRHQLKRVPRKGGGERSAFDIVVTEG